MHMNPDDNSKEVITMSFYTVTLIFVLYRFNDKLIITRLLKINNYCNLQFISN